MQTEQRTGFNDSVIVTGDLEGPEFFLLVERPRQNMAEITLRNLACATGTTLSEIRLSIKGSQVSVEVLEGKQHVLEDKSLVVTGNNAKINKEKEGKVVEAFEQRMEASGKQASRPAGFSKTGS